MKLGEPVEGYIKPPHPKGITLEGNLVILKPLNSIRDSEDLFSANSLDKENKNWTYLPYGPFSDGSKYSEWIEGIEASYDPIFFAIITKNSNKALGIASYLNINLNHGSIEVGHINFSPLLQKTSEATEAMYLMMKWAFKNGYRRYEWKCDALNIKSRRAAQRLGFSYEGVFRQMMINKGRNRDTAWFSTIDKEWKYLKNCYRKYLSEDNFNKHGKPKVSLTKLTKTLLIKKDNLEFS